VGNGDKMMQFILLAYSCFLSSHEYSEIYSVPDMRYCGGIVLDIKELDHDYSQRELEILDYQFDPYVDYYEVTILDGEDAGDSNMCGGVSVFLVSCHDWFHVWDGESFCNHDCFTSMELFRLY
jgi:hypothetical protein